MSFVAWLYLLVGIVISAAIERASYEKHGTFGALLVFFALFWPFLGVLFLCWAVEFLIRALADTN